MRHRFKVCTGALYLGGFIGDGKCKREWINDRTEKNYLCDHQNSRKISLGELRRGGLCDLIIMDIFAMSDIRHGIRVRGGGEVPSEKKTASSFIWKSKYLPPIVVTLSTMTFKKAVLVLQNLATLANKKYLS